MEEKKQSDDIDFFTDLFKWKMDEEELKNQVYIATIRIRV